MLETDREGDNSLESGVKRQAGSPNTFSKLQTEDSESKPKKDLDKEEDYLRTMTDTIHDDRVLENLGYSRKAVNRPCFFNLFVTGRPRDYWNRFGILAGYFFIYAGFMLFVGIRQAESMGSWVIYALTGLWLISVYNFIMAGIKDPGIIPRGDMEFEEFKKYKAQHLKAAYDDKKEFGVSFFCRC